MGRQCAFPNCRNRQKTWSAVSFHKLPLNEPSRYKLWLRALDIDPNTPKNILRRRCIYVCSDHFSPDDLVHYKSSTHPKPTAIPVNSHTADPTAGGSANMTTSPLHDTGAADIQENTPEATGSATREKPALQHIVDEEAILQLIKDCPMCDRRCRCTKFTRGPYFIVYQSCYFCNYQRKWASQPEARDLNIHKAQVTPKRKQQPKDKASGNAKAASSKLVKTRTSSVSESQDPVKTKGVPCQLCLDHD